MHEKCFPIQQVGRGPDSQFVTLRPPHLNIHEAYIYFFYIADVQQKGFLSCTVYNNYTLPALKKIQRGVIQYLSFEAKRLTVLGIGTVPLAGYTYSICSTQLPKDLTSSVFHKTRLDLIHKASYNKANGRQRPWQPNSQFHTGGGGGIQTNMVYTI